MRVPYSFQLLDTVLVLDNYEHFYKKHGYLWISFSFIFFPFDYIPKSEVARWSFYFFFWKGTIQFSKVALPICLSANRAQVVCFYGYCFLFLFFFTHILCHHSLEKLNFRLELVIPSYTILASLWVIESGHSICLCINNQENWSVQKAIFSKVSMQVSNNSIKILQGGKVPLS